MCLEVGLFGRVPLAWDSLCFLDLCDFFSHQIREVFRHYFFKQVFYPCSSSSPSGVPITRILLHFMFSCISLNRSSFFLVFVPVLALSGSFFFTLISSPLIQSFASSSLLLIPSTVSFSSEIVFFISSWFLLIVLCLF